MEQVLVVVTNIILKNKSNLAIMCFGSQNKLFGVSSRNGGMGCV